MKKTQGIHFLCVFFHLFILAFISGLKIFLGKCNLSIQGFNPRTTEVVQQDLLIVFSVLTHVGCTNLT